MLCQQSYTIVIINIVTKIIMVKVNIIKVNNEVKKGKRNISSQEVAKEIKDMFFRLINTIRLCIKSGL